MYIDDIGDMAGATPMLRDWFHQSADVYIFTMIVSVHEDEYYRGDHFIGNPNIFSLITCEILHYINDFASQLQMIQVD